MVRFLRCRGSTQGPSPEVTPPSLGKLLSVGGGSDHAYRMRSMCGTRSRSFRFPLQSADSRRDLVIGGLWLLVPVVGWLMNMGHRIVIVHRMHHGQNPWPAWQDPRAKFPWGRGGSPGRGAVGEHRPPLLSSRPRPTGASPLPLALPSLSATGRPALGRPRRGRGAETAAGPQGGTRAPRTANGGRRAGGRGGPRPEGGRHALATLFGFPTLQAPA
jgi:hypothetical protein